MLKPNGLVYLTAVAALVALAAAPGIATAAVAHPGDCGAYKYWHDGHCVDAREKPGKSWMSGVYV